MRKILNENAITSTYSQMMISAITLIVKRNVKKEIKSLEDLNGLLDDAMNITIENLGKDKSIKVINELLKFEEKDLKDFIITNLDNISCYDMSTPKVLAELMDYLLDIKDSSEVGDFYSGYGNIEEVLCKNHKNINIDGFELNDNLLEFSKLKMYALNNDDKVRYYRKDVLADNIDKKYQYILADIPFINRYDKEVQKSLEKDCKDLNIKLSNRISATWITAIKSLNSLRNNGRAVITAMKGSLFNTLDREIRKELINKRYVEAIIDLPPKLLSNTSVAVSLIILNKLNNCNNIKFVNLKDCFLINGRSNTIDLAKAKNTIKNESIEVNIEKIKDNNYSLNYNIYIGNIEIENGKELGKVSWDIFRGYQITSAEINKMLVENEEEMNYKILEISNINDEGEICSELKMINSRERNLDRYLLRDGDIVISARGDKIKKCLIHIGYDERIIANGSINVIRADQNRLYPLYLKTFLDSEKGTISLNNIKSGVTIPSINVGDLQKMLIPCPSMEEQRKIVDKIELKLEIIESTAKRLEELKKELKNMADLI